MLRRLGLERIGQLCGHDVPRAPLALRFGQALMQRLDQALGRVAEPIMPVIPPEVISHRLAFADPIFTPSAFEAVIGRLTEAVCRRLEHAGEGARRLDLLFERVDGSVQAVRIGTARPARAPAHLAGMLAERLEDVDPEPGVEAMRLLVSLAEPLGYVQAGSDLIAGATADVAVLVDRLINRLGSGRVFRAVPVESDVPERSVCLVPPLAPAAARQLAGAFATADPAVRSAGAGRGDCAAAGPAAGAVRVAPCASSRAACGRAGAGVRGMVAAGERGVGGARLFCGGG